VALGGSEVWREIMQTPLVQLGGGAYSFVHKWLWEYFLAEHPLDLAEDKAAVTRQCNFWSATTMGTETPYA